MITWADPRRGRPKGYGPGPGLALHRRFTHPTRRFETRLVPEEEPELFARAALGRHQGLCAVEMLRVLVTDYSMARAPISWTFTVAMGPELDLAGISPDQLPELVGTTVVPELPPETAKAVQLPSETSVVVGAGDGPLANLGLGAVRPGVAACSIGTSGALRVMVEQPTVDEQGRVFCYALTDQRWVVGGAINNGGLVLEWCGDALAPELARARR